MQTAAAPAVANHSSANGRELVDERGGRGVGRLGVGVGGSAPLRAIAAAAVMSYNFLAHWDAHHRGATIPAEMKTEIALAANETAMLKLNRGKKLSKAQMVRFTANN